MEKQFLQHASLELLTISKKSELLVSMLSCNSRTADSQKREIKWRLALKNITYEIEFRNLIED